MAAREIESTGSKETLRSFNSIPIRFRSSAVTRIGIVQYQPTGKRPIIKPINGTTANILDRIFISSLVVGDFSRWLVFDSLTTNHFITKIIETSP